MGFALNENLKINYVKHAKIRCCGIFLSLSRTSTAYGGKVDAATFFSFFGCGPSLNRV